jgi:hypothetical protein
MLNKIVPGTPNYQNSQLLVQYVPYHGWVIYGRVDKLRYFASKMDAENYCIKQFKQCPRVTSKGSKLSELPTNSVWTGAPWDRSFKYLH